MVRGAPPPGHIVLRSDEGDRASHDNDGSARVLQEGGGVQDGAGGAVLHHDRGRVRRRLRILLERHPGHARDDSSARCEWLLARER